MESVVLNKGSSTVSQIAIKFLMLNVFIYISSSRVEFNLLGSILALQKLQKEIHQTQRGVFESYSWQEIHSEWTLTTSISFAT